MGQPIQEKNKHEPAAPPRGSARSAAYRKLSEQARKWPDFALSPLSTEGLDDRDAALAHAIYDASMRRWITLEWILDRFNENPLRTMEPSLQAVLIGGAAQLFLMDRIPVHSAIDETVEIAKSVIRPGAGNLVNAVLRKAAGVVGEREFATPPPLGAPWPRNLLPMSDGRWLTLKEIELPEEELPRIGVATSHPAWLIKRWAMRRARTEIRDLALHSLVAAPTTLNTRYAALPLPAGLIPHEQKECHSFTGSHQELAALLAERNDLWVQDAASCRAVEGAHETCPFRQGTIVDMCAGQGTKTRHLAAAYPEATIYATDTDERRLARLFDQFQSHERVKVINPGEVLLTLNGRADLVMLDVPCTNTGVLARRVEARYRCDDEQLKRLTDIQKQIIADSIPLLKSRPRGRILYSTCSLEPEENQAQADWTARWHSLKLIGHEQRFPRGLPGESAAAYSDGAFWAALG